MAVNLDANLLVMQACHPLLKLAPRGGRVVVIGSKNVPAPGPGAAAYSASKAALNQLARVAALEWGEDGIRINTLHPNAVFDTALWTDEVLAPRAKAYGLTVEQYKTNNLLQDRSDLEGRRGTRRRDVRPAVRQDHRGAGAGGRRQRARDLGGRSNPSAGRATASNCSTSACCPTRPIYVTCRTAAEVAEAIRDMVVRGAPAIGCAAAFGVALGASAIGPEEPSSCSRQAGRRRSICSGRSSA